MLCSSIIRKHAFLEPLGQTRQTFQNPYVEFLKSGNEVFDEQRKVPKEIEEGFSLKKNSK